MIPIMLVLGLSVAAIALLAKYWQNIVKWIKKAVNKIQEVLKVLVEGTRTFISKLNGQFVNKSKYYYKNKVTKEFEEVIYTREVDLNEIPPEIMAKFLNATEGTDISTTDELKLNLESIGR